jgi:hypothetical protein
MITKGNKEAAFDYARERAQRLGIDQFVVDLDNGRFAIGSEKKASFYYPDFEGWYVRYIY